MAFCGIVWSTMVQADENAKPGETKIRLLSYNVEFSKSTTPEQVGEAIKSLNLDRVIVKSCGCLLNQAAFCFSPSVNFTPAMTS